MHTYRKGFGIIKQWRTRMNMMSIHTEDTQDQKKVITYRPYYKKSGTSLKICDYFKIDGHGGFVQKYEIYDFIRRGYDLVFDTEKVSEKKYFKHFKENFSEEKYYLSLIETQKEREDDDVEFLNRIIRNGGYSQYAYYLEDRIAKQVQQTQPI